MSLDNFQEHFSWTDSMKGVALKRPWLQTMFCTISHVNSNITIQNCKEQKSEHVLQKERSMTHQVRANAPYFIQYILPVFEEDVEAALTKACELACDNDVVNLHVRQIPCTATYFHSMNLPRRLFAITVTSIGEHGPKGSQH